MEAYGDETKATKTDLLNTPPEGTETPADAPESDEGIKLPTVEELTAKGINESMAAALAGGDYDALKKAIDEVIAEEVDKRITPNIPKSKQTEDYANQLKAFESMGYKDRLELSKKNPRLYRELTARSLQS